MRFRSSRPRSEILRERRLRFESLERRDLLTALRIVNWNTLNGPNDAAGEMNFATILQAIGNETVQGNTQRIDILALQETDAVVPGGSNSIERVDNVLNSLYPSANYEFIASALDGGGDSTGFVYDTTTVSLLESVQVEPGSLIHNVMRGKFRPNGTLGESDLYIYSVHLKSGDSGSDAAQRGNEAALIRADADALNDGANVLFVGDFNMKSSFETGYVNLVAPGFGQVQDVADAPGDWTNNSAFKNLHSQDPRTTMDDRFDIQFASGEFFDGVGLEYVGNSFHIFGNNGTHTLDAPITTGTGASSTVLNALVAASDHLPAVADYQIVTLTPNVRVTQTLGGTKAIEGGLYDTYHVVLDTVPSANVTVTVTPDSQLDLGNGAGIAKVLTFTPANALTPQTVAVNAVNDIVGEGDHSGLISHGSASTDPAYNGLSISGVVVSIVDNDAPKIVINEVDSDQASTDTMEFVELYDGGVGNVSLSGKTVVFFNGNGNVAYRVIDLAGQFTDSNGFFVLGNSAVPGVDLVFPGNGLQNGEDAVALYAGLFTNGAAVTTTNLLDAIVYRNGQTDGSGLLVLLAAGQSSVNENQNGAGTTQSLSRVPDGGSPRRTSTYVAQAPTPATFNTTYPYGVEFLQSASRVDVQEGGAIDTYQVALESIPTANVAITVEPDDQTNLGAGPGVAIVLGFTPATALIPQMITVTAVDDAAIEGVHTSTITLTSASFDSKYNALPIANVVANIVDNDVSAPASVVISEIMYNPASDETSPGIGEWIEVVNAGASAVDLGGWLFDDEDATNWGAIPAGTILNPSQIAVFYDSDFTTAATFRADWSVPNSALVVGISWGSLANTPSPTNEILQLLNNVGVQMDLVNLNDTSPWPSAADGPSIYLENLSLDNNNGANWSRSAMGAARAVAPAGAAYSTADVGSPGRFFLPGDYNLNGAVDAADYVVWRDTLGSTTDLRADGSGPTTGTPNGVVDQFDYAFWRANFGSLGVPGTGSGSGSEAATGALAMAVRSSARPTTANIANDAAISGFGFVPSRVKVANNSGSAFSSVPTQPARSADPLLTLLRTDRSPSYEANSVGGPSSSADEHDDIDTLFASSGGDDWLGGLKMLSALL